MARLCDPKLCTGCTACAAACSAGCISMVQDEEGFRRPVTDASRCVECGLCTRACPVLNAPETHATPRAFAARNQDESVRAQSTSGGVFTLLAEHTLKKGGVVFGAAYDDNFRVAHRMVERAEDLAALRGAKYAQSDLGDSFRQVKAQLSAGREVLFSGTPCQIAGLRSYLGREEERLLLVDLVCHGVPSPAVWEQYLQQKNADERPVSVNQRSKVSGWSTYSVDIRWADGKQYLASNREDPYLRAFVGDLCLRPSCHQCSCKGLNRPADFTLGDFWGVWDLLPAMSDNKGTSIVLVHSPKAQALWDALTPRMTVQEVDAQRCMEQNPAALRPAACDEAKRSTFLRRFAAEDMGTLTDELLPRPGAAVELARRVAGKLKRMLKK